MPIAAVHELITDRVRVKVTSHGYCYYCMYRFLLENRSSAAAAVEAAGGNKHA